MSSTLGSTSGSCRISSAKQLLPGGMKISGASEPRMNVLSLLMFAAGKRLGARSECKGC